jgi:hypothetical protein
VLRFTDEQVLERHEPVVAAILAELQKPFDRRAERAANAAGRPRELRPPNPTRPRKKRCSSPTQKKAKARTIDG